MKQIVLAAAGLLVLATPAIAESIKVGHPDLVPYISRSNPSGFIEGSWEAGVGGANLYLFNPAAVREIRVAPAPRYLLGDPFHGLRHDTNGRN